MNETKAARRMARVHRVTGRALLACLFMSTATPAFGQAAAPSAADVAQSKRMIGAADKLKAQGACDVAVEQYEAAYKLAPAAAPLRSALDCYKQLNQKAGALAAAQRLLDKHGKELKKPEAAELKKLVGASESEVGKIDIVAESGASVTIDGREIGTTPLPGPVSIDAGKRVVTLKKAGFEPFEKTVDVQGKQTTSIEARLEEEIKTAEIVVRESKGVPVTVVVDGVEKGPAPWKGTLPLGKHTVAVRSKTHASPAKDVELVKRQVAEVDVEAQATTGRLELKTSDNQGVIRVDGTVVGEGGFAGDLPSGEHLVQVRRDGYKPFEQKVNIDAGAASELRVVLTPEAPVAAAEPPSDGHGVYGGFRFAGLLQVTESGNETQLNCQGLASPAGIPVQGAAPNVCSTKNAQGGGLMGHVGYAWPYFGVEALFGASGDVTTSDTAIQNTRDTRYDIVRVGAMGALRARLFLQTRAIRFSLAAGPGIAQRWGIIGDSSASYLAPAGNVDLMFGLRLSRTTALTVGAMLWMEKPTKTATGSVPDADSFRLYTGMQTMIMPHIGFEFGP